MSRTTNSTFSVRKWDGESQYGEKQWLYSDMKNNLADDIDDAYEKAVFAFEDSGVRCERLNDTDFRTADGEEYRICLDTTGA